MYPPTVWTPPQNSRAVPTSSGPAKRVRRSFAGTTKTGLSIAASKHVPGNPQASLDRLPDELILLVCQCISGHDHSAISQTNALASLCLANKHLNRIVTECLYKRIAHGHPNNYAMTQTLVKDQRLAKYVMEVEVLENLPMLSPRQTEQQYTHVLLTTTNLQALTILDCHSLEERREDGTTRWPWLGAFSNIMPAALNSSLNMFAHLKKLRLEVRCGLMAAHVRFAFRLPSLRELSLGNLFGPGKIGNWDVPESSSNIRILNLGSCFLDSAVVVQMLSPIKALEQFRYQYTSEHWQPLSPADDSRTHWAENSWDEIGYGLLKHQSSLTTLVLREEIDSFAEDIVYSHVRDAGTLGSLRNFHQLRIVCVPFESLINPLHECSLAQKLPAGLEQLILTIRVRKENCHVYNQALMSLKDGIFTRPTKFVRVNLYSEIPVGRLSLHGVFEVLTQAGIYICVYREKDGQLQRLKAESLKEMQEEDFMEEESDLTDLEEGDEYAYESTDEYDPDDAEWYERTDANNNQN